MLKILVSVVAAAVVLLFVIGFSPASAKKSSLSFVLITLVGLGYGIFFPF